MEPTNVHRPVTHSGQQQYAHVHLSASVRYNWQLSLLLSCFRAHIFIVPIFIPISQAIWHRIGIDTLFFWRSNVKLLGGEMRIPSCEYHRKKNWQINESRFIAIDYCDSGFKSFKLLIKYINVCGCCFLKISNMSTGSRNQFSKSPKIL